MGWFMAVFVAAYIATAVTRCGPRIFFRPVPCDASSLTPREALMRPQRGAGRRSMECLTKGDGEGGGWYCDKPASVSLKENDD